MVGEDGLSITPDTVVHRIGSGHKENLQLSQLEKELIPPGISVLLGRTPQAAAQQMRNAFPRSRKWLESSRRVGTTTVQAIKEAGFEIRFDPTDRFPNHARLIHPSGVEGFTDENLERLAQAFEETVEG